jgi:hypothetical protein
LKRILADFSLLGRTFVMLMVVSGASSPAHSYIGGTPTYIDSIVNLHPAVGPDCTAVKVGNNHFLTAAHCVAMGLPPGSKVSLRLRLGDPINFIVETTVTALYVHPRLKNLRLDRKHANVPDLAIFEVASSNKIPAMPVCLHPLTAGTVIYVGGFGNKGPGVVNFQYYTGAYKKISSFENTDMKVGLRDADETNISMGSPGDSGGPALVISGNKTSVIGINSSGSHLPDIFRMDKDTGKILRSSVDNPTLNIVRLGYNTENDSYDVVSWLKSHLPESSFTTCGE